MDNLLLERGVAEVIDSAHLRERLQRGDKLRVKLGIDTNKPDLHIGHAIPLWKLRDFQDAGHTPVLIIGDYTAQLGDPTDRSEARKILSAEETKANAEHCLAQVFQILDPDKTEVHANSEWFTTFDLRRVIELMASTTLNNLLAHETFAQRLDGGMPLYPHEILYPLLQGYDSVMVKADVELGGMDQKFNVLMGRLLQRVHGQPEQDIMLFPYLMGTDGKTKMSKSLGNTINLTDTAEDMFGKVMSIPDSQIVSYFELATRVSEVDIAQIKQLLASKDHNPRDSKLRLARALVMEYHGAAQAEASAQAFDAVFRRGELPADREVLVLPSGSYDLGDVLVARSTLVASKSEVRRLIHQRGIKVNGEVATDPAMVLDVSVGDPIIIQVGPRRFLELTWRTTRKSKGA